MAKTKNEVELRKCTVGDIINLSTVLDEKLDILTQEDYDKLLKAENDKHQRFVEQEEWMKHVEWKTVSSSIYALKIKDDEYKVIKIDKQGNSLNQLAHSQKTLDGLFNWHPLLNSFKYDEFTQKKEFNGEKYDEDTKPPEIFNFFKRNFNEWCPRVDIKEAIQETLNRNTYHSYKDWLNSMKWDGEERLETFLIDYYGAEDTPLNRVYFKRWMIAMMKRIDVPGSKFDAMLILAGEQGKKKSTLFVWLGTINGVTYYAEVPDNLKDTNSLVYSSLGKVIMTFDDFDDICNKGELGKIKSFITTQNRTTALKWQHNKEYPITYVLGASTNQYDILVDDATFDERRFWIVKVNPKNDEFDIPDEIKEQLYAEAWYLYNQDKQQKLWIWEPELKEEEKKLQANFKRAKTDPMADVITKIFNRKYPIVNGMFDSEEQFLNCVSKYDINDSCGEQGSELVGTRWEYISMIPSNWIIRWLGIGKRSTDRIVQILHTQGFRVEKVPGYLCYGCQLTVIKIYRNLDA